MSLAPVRLTLVFLVAVKRCLASLFVAISSSIYLTLQPVYKSYLTASIYILYLIQPVYISYISYILLYNHRLAHPVDRPHQLVPQALFSHQRPPASQPQQQHPAVLPD